MKLTLEQIVLGFFALQRIGNEKMPIKISYNIQRNMRLLKPDFETREEERKNLIKTKYGVKNADGEFEVPPAKMEAFLKNIKELDSVEIDLDIHPISMEDFNKEIAPNDLFALEWMFIETPGVPPKKSILRHNPKPQ